MAHVMTPGRALPRHLWIGGFPIGDTSAEELIALLNSRLASALPTELHFANTNFIIGCQMLCESLKQANSVIVNDGIGIDLACRWLHGRSFTANLNGTDFTPRLLAHLDRPRRIFLLGGSPVVVCKTAQTWSSYPQVEVVGAVDGYEGMRDQPALIDAIRRAAPDILLVALGNPRQEAWIVSNRVRHQVTLVIGVGALFDFVSGSARRAPRFVRRIRLEWLHRLALEPRRLAKRYTVDVARFFLHCARMRDVGRAEMDR